MREERATAINPPDVQPRSGLRPPNGKVDLVLTDSSRNNHGMVSGVLTTRCKGQQSLGNWWGGGGKGVGVRLLGRRGLQSIGEEPRLHRIPWNTLGLSYP